MPTSSRHAALTGNELYRDVVRYASMGDHRTGTTTDGATAQWINEELCAAGFASSTVDWPLRYFDLKQCCVALYGQRIEALPLWHPCATPLDGITQRLVHIDSDDLSRVTGRIVLFSFNDIMVTPKSEHGRVIEQLADAGALAVIGCFADPSGEIYGHNVIPPHNQQPWPIPVVTVSPSHWHILHHAAAVGDELTLLVDGEDHIQAQASSVLANLQRDSKWLIVSTPQSGWFRCAGERGCGVALLLGLARWLGSFAHGPSCLFMSNSGHEIGHMGMHHVMSNVTLPTPDDVICWLHLGASIAVRDWREDGSRLHADGVNRESWLLGSEDMLPLLADSFSNLPHIEPRRYDLKQGEIRWILEQGYSGFAMMGPHRFFHLASDGPEVTSPELLEPVADALADALFRLATHHELPLTR